MVNMVSDKMAALIGIGFLALLIGGYYLTLPADSNDPTKLYFDDNSPVMYFYRAGCHACELQEDVLDNLARQGFRVKGMDIGVHLEYIDQYSIEGTPTFIAENGSRLIGFKSEGVLGPWLTEHGAKIAQAE